MTVLLAELAEVLAQHGAVQCAVQVERGEDGPLEFRVTAHPRAVATLTDRAALGLECLELREEVQRLADLGTMRALLRRYPELDARWLENFLERRAPQERS